MCAGGEYARLQTLVYMHNVVTRFKWEKAIPDEKISYQLSSIPVNGLPVILKPHKFQIELKPLVITISIFEIQENTKFIINFTTKV